jgi:hypothetical protein
MLLVDLTYIGYSTKMSISKIDMSLLFNKSYRMAIVVMLTFADFAACLCIE